jgi:hypothetical protein
LVRRSQHDWYIPAQKISLAENRFLQASTLAENTKEKSRQCLTGGESKVGLMDKILGLGVSIKI